MYWIRIMLFTAALSCYCNLQARNTEIDSLKKVLITEKQNEERVSILENLSYAYLSSHPDTALQYALEGLQLARDIKYVRGEAICTNAVGNVYFHTGDNAKALEMYLLYLELKEDLKDFNNLSIAYYNIASVYAEDEDYSHALDYLFKAKQEDGKAKDTAAILYDSYSLGTIYLRMHKTDSALYYINLSHDLARYLDDQNMIGAVLNTFGEIYFFINNTDTAAKYYMLSLPYTETVNDRQVLTSNYYGLAKVYKQKGMQDSSIYYARKAFYIAKNAPFYKEALETGSFLSELFKTKNKYDSAFHYQELSVAIRDSLFNMEQLKKVQNLKFQEQQRQQSIETEKMRYRNTIKLFIVISVSIIFLIVAIILWRNNKEKHKANLLLAEQKNKIESTLSELRSTQAQLIQAEKMASLGELTSGIAHEIQNPLNFVNNFSEISSDLLTEMKTELATGNLQVATEIADDLQQNLDRIVHHGKRADAIVKGMMQHSDRNTGQKEPADINALADEYLQLSYHRMHAKDKTFKPKIKTGFDESIGEINIISQDVGKVLLNFYNNAFYAVNEKMKSRLLSNSANNELYEPAVEVSTKLIKFPFTDAGVVIRIKDNGTGIPEKITGKIFQPFFTTKPTGQGTGLGLSLAYDIIKAHGGEVKVETKEGEGSEFIILLPIG